MEMTIMRMNIWPQILIYTCLQIFAYLNQLTRSKFILLFVLYFVEKYLCMYPCCLFVIVLKFIKNKVKNKNKHIEIHGRSFNRNGIKVYFIYHKGLSANHFVTSHYQPLWVGLHIRRTSWTIWDCDYEFHLQKWFSSHPLESSSVAWGSW